MDYCEFYFYEGNFICDHFVGENLVDTIYDRDAKELLKKLDEKRILGATIKSKSVIIQCNHLMIKIIDFSKFERRGLTKYIPNSIREIKKSYIKRQVKKFEKKTINYVNANKGKVACGALVIALLTNPVVLSKTLQVNNTPEKNKYNIEQLDQDNNLFENYYDKDQTEISSSDFLDKESQTEQEEITTEVIEEQPSTEVEVEDMSQSEKALYAKEKYGDTVAKYSMQWGVSSDIIMAMLTQESGGKVENLMQIQFGSWKDMELTSYDFNKEEMRTIVLTDTPEQYNGKGYTCITRKDLQNPITNISVGCLLLKKSAEPMQHHIGATIQNYNFGTSNMKKVLEETSRNTGVSIDEILHDQTNLTFMNYTDIIDEGDKDYLYHVMQYMNQPEETNLMVMNDNQEVESYSVSYLRH